MAHLQDKSLFQSSDILAVQFYADRRVKPEMEPERRLAHAVLADAVRCFQINMGAKSWRKIREFTDVKSWLFQRGDNGPFSFDGICYLLDVHPDALRQALRRWRALKLAGAPCRPLIQRSSVKGSAITISNKASRLPPTVK